MPSRWKAGLALAAIMVLPSAGFSITKEEVIQPFKNRLWLCEAAQSEIARQGSLYLAELQKREMWRATLFGAIDLNVEDMQTEHRRLSQSDKTATGAIGPLQALDAASSFVPHYNWITDATMTERSAATAKAIADAEAAVSNGTASFFVHGANWISRSGLQGVIGSEARAITEQQSAIEDGTWAINYPGLNWITREGAEACAEQQSNKILELEQSFSDGTYKLNLPNIGWTDYVGLKARIRSVEDQLAEVRATASLGKLSINRAGHNWFNLKEITAQLAATQSKAADIDIAVSLGTFKHHFSAVGWVDEEILAKSIEAENAEIKDVNASAGAGEYRVPSGAGWLNRNEAKAALALPNCRDGGPRPCLTSERRRLVEDALSRIPQAISTDVAIRQLKVERSEAFLAALPGHATSEFGRLKWLSDTQTILQTELARELSQHEQRLLSEIEWLKANLKHFP